MWACELSCGWLDAGHDENLGREKFVDNRSESGQIVQDDGQTHVSLKWVDINIAHRFEP
jgi:hypothetical protein